MGTYMKFNIHGSPINHKLNVSLMHSSIVYEAMSITMPLSKGQQTTEEESFIAWYSKVSSVAP